MVDSTNRRRFLAASGGTVIGLGGLFGAGTAGAQQEPGEGFDRILQWGGQGSENATQDCPGELGFWKWVLTPGGALEPGEPAPPLELPAQLTVTFTDGTTQTVQGFFPGGPQGTIQFEVFKPGGGTVESAFVEFNGGGANPILTISEGDCVEDPDPPERPTVITDPATEVDDGSATLNGELTSLGGFETVDVFFEYRVAGTTEWLPTEPLDLSAPGPFSATVPELESGLEYEFRAVAVAPDTTTVTGSIRTFRKELEPVVQPTVMTGPATDVNESTATLNGMLVDLGDFAADDIQVFFEYRIVGSEEWLETAPQVLPGTGPFSAEIDVVPGNDYEYRAVAVANGVRTVGEVQTFTKEDPDPEVTLPTVGTEPATEINEASATLNGELVDLGTFDEVEVFFQFRIAGMAEDWTTTASQTLTAPGPFSAEAVGLTPGVEYEFRAVAVANESVVVGPTQRFTKEEPPVDLPTVVTEPATDVNESTATLNGELVDLGGFDDADVFFQYRVVSADEWLGTAPTTVTGPTAFSAEISGLEEGFQYEFRAVAVANDVVATGETLTFTKEAPDVDLPTVVTEPATDVNESTATLNGELVDLGDFDEVNAFFQYRVAGTDEWLETEFQPLAAPTAFDAVIAGLQTGLRYEFRAVVVADGIAVAGDILAFTKDEPEPIPEPDPVPEPVPEPEPVIRPPDKKRLRKKRAKPAAKRAKRKRKKQTRKAQKWAKKAEKNRSGC
ncbi:phage tail protein [Natronobacterium gregoryi]|uniref:Fibronectin type III domain-containing protein n=2 Tax=Natronobacterium gregoryi TaxID=44930 RepID=L0AKY9_NATGS|nr:hypothetical protein [Natronobacterium gregoryi]AFZ74094.1 hypothetical protein Natgr_2958 [Natronobacterium gregoryi SP2]ELY70302.1 hypothetical protein C490_06804 [Natronobacterium gregoryi SP2]PLK18634.1 hypothetical protein CYV19_17605 [Natronobacterium gregoryi SP2]SFJ61929.1 hypothetical protein SAMN05443661_14715 [Natronobacterium gregoryi]